MEIKIEDYLSDEEIKEIVKQEVRDRVKQIVGQPNSFPTKYMKSALLDHIQEVVPNFAEMLNEHIKEQIASIRLENLFWQSLGWKSEGNKLINKILANNEELIEAKVKEIFKT